MNQIIFKSITLTVFAIIFSNLASAACTDISGQYRPEWENSSDDVVTTIVYSQIKCDTLIISGFSIGKPFHESEGQVYGSQILSLESLPEPKNEACLYNSVRGVCASYTATANYILKMTDETRLIYTDDGHVCQYTSSQLYKDSAGNLNELPQNVTCVDGVKRIFPAIVYPKANN